MLELTLSTRDSSLNLALLNAEGMKVYTISTPHTFVAQRTSTILRHVLGADKLPTDETEEVARIHWRSFQGARLVYKGQILDFRSFMPRDGIFKE